MPLQTDAEQIELEAVSDVENGKKANTPSKSRKDRDLSREGASESVKKKKKKKKESSDGDPTESSKKKKKKTKTPGEDEADSASAKTSKSKKKKELRGSEEEDFGSVKKIDFATYDNSVFQEDKLDDDGFLVDDDDL